MKFILKNPSLENDVRLRLIGDQVATLDITESIGTVTPEDSNTVSVCVSKYIPSKLNKPTIKTKAIAITDGWIIEVNGVVSPVIRSIASLARFLEGYSVTLLTHKLDEQATVSNIEFVCLNGDPVRLRFITAKGVDLSTQVSDHTVSFQRDYFDIYLAGDGSSLFVEPHTDTMFILDHPPWDSALYNIEVNGVVYDMSGCLALDSGTHFVYNPRGSSDSVYANPIPSPLKFPTALGELIKVNYLPESGSLWIKNNTNQELKVRFIPLQEELYISHDGLNKTAFVDSDGTLSFALTPKQEYNPEIDDLVYSVTFPEGLADEPEVMLGIAYNYNYLHSADDWIEVETVWGVSEGKQDHVFSTTETGNGTFVYRMNPHTDANFKDSSVNGTAYIWFQFIPTAEIPTAEIRVRTSRPIHQLELWNVSEIKSWGRYVCDQPYCVGRTWGGAKTLRSLGESSPTLPGYMIIEDFFQPECSFNIYDMVMNNGRYDLNLEGQDKLPALNTRYYEYTPIPIAGAAPILGDIHDGSYPLSAIPDNVDTLVFTFKADKDAGHDLNIVATGFIKDNSGRATKRYVGVGQSNNINYMSYEYNAVTGTTTITVDVNAFKTRVGYNAPKGIKDLRLTFKRKWAYIKTGKIDVSIDGYLKDNAEPIYSFNRIYDSTYYSKYPNVWSDFIGLTEHLYLNAAAPVALDIGLMFQYPVTSKAGSEYRIKGLAGSTVLVWDRDGTGMSDVKTVIGDKVHPIRRYPRNANGTYYLLDMEGEVSIPLSNFIDADPRAFYVTGNYNLSLPEPQKTYADWVSQVDPSLRISGHLLKELGVGDSIYLPSDTYMTLGTETKEYLMSQLDRIDSCHCNISLQCRLDDYAGALRPEEKYPFHVDGVNIDFTVLWNQFKEHLRANVTFDEIGDYYDYYIDYAGDSEEYLNAPQCVKDFVQYHIDAYKEKLGFDGYDVGLLHVQMHFALQWWSDNQVVTNGQPSENDMSIIFFVAEPRIILKTNKPLPTTSTPVYLQVDRTPGDPMYSTESDYTDKTYVTSYPLYGKNDEPQNRMDTATFLIFEGKRSNLEGNVVIDCYDATGTRYLFPEDTGVPIHQLNASQPSTYKGDVNMAVVMDGYGYERAYIVHSV